jgi:predicted secreted protein
MQRKEGRVAMGRLAASVGTLLALSLPAMAGDRAGIDIIGYSEDARYFAFEEFGIQDGSGFAYSAIYMVDLVEDAWVVGTPVRLQADDEGATLAQIRAEVQLQAADDLDALGMTLPAHLVALVGDGMPDLDGQALRFGFPAYGVREVNDDFTLELNSYFAPSAAPCEDWFGSEPLGFALTLVQGDSSAVLHEDESLPRSRGCPLAYRLYGVVLPFQAQDLSAGVALVSVYPGGFEGPDRRFIAVPIGN